MAEYFRDTTGKDTLRFVDNIFRLSQAGSEVSAYVATLSGAKSAATLGGDASTGKAAYGTCVACHGANGEGNQALNAPKLGGLQDWYVARQLKNFKTGVRGLMPKTPSAR